MTNQHNGRAPASTPDAGHDTPAPLSREGPGWDARHEVVDHPTEQEDVMNRSRDVYRATVDENHDPCGGVGCR